MVNVEKNQYILSSAELNLPNMRHFAKWNWHLYSDGLLKTNVLKNAANEDVVLIGYAFCTDEQDKKAEADIAAWDGADLIALTRYWTGRWALFTEHGFCTDAGSMMSAFYCTVDGKSYITSSLALLEQIRITHRVREQKLNSTAWQILPETGFEGVKKLLCTQKLQLSNDGIRVVPHIWIKDYRTLNASKKAERLAKLLVNGVSNIHLHSRRRLYLALTGGKDSRLVLAAMLKSKVPFSAYTCEHDDISTWDVTVPKRLSKKYSFPYTYIKRPKQMNTDYLEDFERFNAGNAHGEDENFYSYKQFDALPRDAVIIRGGFFEAGQTYARSYARADEHFRNDIENCDLALKNDALQKKGLDEWLENTLIAPVDYIDIRDRYYLEQRVGGWGASIEQALSINDFLSVQIANCAELLSILLSCSSEERARLALSFEPIKILNEELLREPFNSVTVVDRLKRAKKFLKSPVSKLKKAAVKVKLKIST